MTDPCRGTPTHRLSDQYSHHTDVGPRWGQDGASFTSAGNWRIYENARQMTEAGADPAAVVIEHGHRAGLEVFLSMRMNDVHDSYLEGGLDDPLMSPMKREHADWLLRGKGHASTAYNFALPEVRDYKVSLATADGSRHRRKRTLEDTCEPVYWRQETSRSGCQPLRRGGWYDWLT